MIYTLGDVSGAHLNPALTIGFWAAQRFPAQQVRRYIGAQISGALLASLILKLLFPANANLGATHPVGSAMQSFVLEFILTFLIMFVIRNFSTGAKEKASPPESPSARSSHLRPCSPGRFPVLP
jgi:aquaporin Z